MRNKAIFASNATSIKRESGQKGGNTTPEDHRQHPAGPEASKPDHLWTIGHAKRQAADHLDTLPSFLDFKNILVFRPLLSPKIPRKHQAPQKIINFCPFLPKICHDWSRKGSKKGWEQPGSIQKGIPPPSGERKECLAPIIFRAIKVEKSSPKGLVDVENFSEIFSGECFGEKESPQSCGEGARGKAYNLK